MTLQKTTPRFGVLWLFFAAFIVYGATVPFHWTADSGAALDTLRHLPLNPFVSPETGRRLAIPDVMENLLLFMPFGALGVLAGDPTRRVWPRIVLVTTAGVVLSAGVECLQLLTTDRVPSLGDVLVDTAGCILGAALAARFRSQLDAGLEGLRSARLANGREWRSLAIAVVLLVMASWQPFDVTIEVGSLAGKRQALLEDLWQTEGWQHAGASFMLSAFLAMTFAGYLSVLGTRGAGLKATAVGMGSVSLLEASQLFIGSRMPGVADALVASAGVGTGAAIWTLAGRIAWPRLWLGVLAAMTLAAATVQMLAPVTPATTLFEAVRRAAELALLYFPLGFWIGQAGPTGVRAYVTGLALSMALMSSTWALHYWIQGRYPWELVPAGMCLAGVSLGIKVGSAR